MLGSVKAPPPTVETVNLADITVEVSTVLPAPVEQCWQTVREFGKLSAYVAELQICDARCPLQTSMLVG